MVADGSRFLADTYTTWMQRLGENPQMDLPAVRDMFEEWQFAAFEPEGVTYADVDADGVPCKWAWPAEPSDAYILYMHGGGYTAGSVHSHRKLGGHLANLTGRNVLLVDYRRAPEVAYPAPLDDCDAALRWLVQERGVEVSSVVLAGDSAGGNFSLSLAYRRREQGDELPAALVLFSPFVDLRVTGDSWDTNRIADALTPDDPSAPNPADQAVMAYLQGQTTPDDPYVNALTADLTGFPPIYVAVGSVEALRDDSTRLVEHARAAGVNALVEVVDDMQHVFPLMAGRAREADETLASVARWLADHTEQS